MIEWVRSHYLRTYLPEAHLPERAGAAASGRVGRGGSNSRRGGRRGRTRPFPLEAVAHPRPHAELESVCGQPEATRTSARRRASRSSTSPGTRRRISVRRL